MSRYHFLKGHGLFLCCLLLSLLIVLSPVFANDTDARLQEIFEKGWALESRMHIDLSNLDKARALYEEAIRIAPENAEAKRWLAEIIFKQAEEENDKRKKVAMYEQAATLAERAIAINPESVAGFYWAGTANARLADLTWFASALSRVNKAKEYLQTAIDTDTTNRYAVLAGVVLAAIYADAPWPVKDMDRAVELAQWAVSQDRNLTFASLRLGKIYLANGEKEKAVKTLERCLNTENPTYIWDAELYDWPEAKKILSEIK
ncbi:MAG: tetratricopeptide repeat protein [Thermodesulfobacteriota bacterium]|nr:tetratricopeptide repeat protein [Thermodesulfobacteriota bacterium]